MEVDLGEPTEVELVAPMEEVVKYSTTSCSTR
jgi:hypothetical protein